MTDETRGDKTMRVFYVRCSTIEQNEARQLKMAEEQNAEKLFIDKASGKNTDRAAFKEMMAFVRAGEAHVFQEVSETALALFFLHAADLLRDVEAGEILGQCVVTDVVGKSVGQLTDAHILVNGQFRNGLRPCRQPHERCQQDKKEFDFFHDEMECKW